MTRLGTFFVSFGCLCWLQLWVILLCSDSEFVLSVLFTLTTVFIGALKRPLNLKTSPNKFQYNENLSKSLPEEEEIELTPDFRLPYFTDESDSEDDGDTRETCSSLSLATSGYNTDIDLDWEYCKSGMKNGPVPSDRVYLTFSCQITGFYVKAVVDKDHSMIYIFTYEKQNHGEWEWIETKCATCISKVRNALADGGCTVRFAMDFNEIAYDGNSESEDSDYYVTKRKKKRIVGRNKLSEVTRVI